mmetsp:Transcript_13720/g.31306  ORF Transcript_13720/g.31306 Transcript_13720/m.31306 type:complete len:340 (+) Transcript_13720:1285-2304(+)
MLRLEGEALLLLGLLLLLVRHPPTGGVGLPDQILIPREELHEYRVAVRLDHFPEAVDAGCGVHGSEGANGVAYGKVLLLLARGLLLHGGLAADDDVGRLRHLLLLLLGLGLGGRIRPVRLEEDLVAVLVVQGLHHLRLLLRRRLLLVLDLRLLVLPLFLRGLFLLRGLLVVLVHLLPRRRGLGLLGRLRARRLHGRGLYGHAAPRRGELARLELLLEHGLPDPPPGVGEPVLELFLVDAGLLHEHDLVLRRGVRVGEVLGAEEPSLERRHGPRGELAAALRLGLASPTAARAVVVLVVGHAGRLRAQLELAAGSAHARGGRGREQGGGRCRWLQSQASV